MKRHCVVFVVALVCAALLLAWHARDRLLAQQRATSLIGAHQRAARAPVQLDVDALETRHRALLAAVQKQRATVEMRQQRLAVARHSVARAAPNVCHAVAPVEHCLDDLVRLLPSHDALRTLAENEAAADALVRHWIDAASNKV